jgi:hypothetical protein
MRLPQLPRRLSTLSQQVDQMVPMDVIVHGGGGLCTPVAVFWRKMDRGDAMSTKAADQLDSSPRRLDVIVSIVHCGSKLRWLSVLVQEFHKQCGVSRAGSLREPPHCLQGADSSIPHPLFPTDNKLPLL